MEKIHKHKIQQGTHIRPPWRQLVDFTDTKKPDIHLPTIFLYPHLKESALFSKVHTPLLGPNVGHTWKQLGPQLWRVYMNVNKNCTSIIINIFLKNFFILNVLKLISRTGQNERPSLPAFPMTLDKPWSGDKSRTDSKPRIDKRKHFLVHKWYISYMYSFVSYKQ